MKTNLSQRLHAASLAAAAFALLAAPAARASAPPAALTPLSPPCIAENGTGNGCTVANSGLTTPQAIAVSSDDGGRNVYTVTAGGVLATLSRNLSTGPLSFVACIKNGSSTEPCATNAQSGALASPSALAISPDGQNVYVASGATISVFQRSLAAATYGLLTQLTGAGSQVTMPGSGTITAMAVFGNQLYAVSRGGKALAVFARGAGGALAAPSGTGTCLLGSTAAAVAGCTTAAGLNGVNDLAVAPDGTHVYTTSSYDVAPAESQTSAAGLECQQNVVGPAATIAGQPCSAVDEWSRNASTGALTLVACRSGDASNEAGCPTHVHGLDGADAVAVSHDGQNVYVASGPLAVATTTPTGSTTAWSGLSLTTLSGGLAFQSCVFESGASHETGCNAATGLGAAGDGASATAGGPGAVAVGADDAAVFVGTAPTSTSGDVAAFRRNTSTGALAQLAGTHNCVGEGVGECGTTLPSGDGLANVGGATGDVGKTATATLPASLVAAPVAATDAATVAPFVYASSSADSAVSEFSVEAAPTCSGTTQSVAENSSAALTLSCTDLNLGVGETIPTVTMPSSTTGGGTLSSPSVDASTGQVSVQYQPASGFTGTDTFTFTVTDSAGNTSAPATVTLDVSAVTYTLTLSDASVSQPATGTTTMSFPLTLNQAAPAGGIGVSWSTSACDGPSCAVPSEDFLAVSNGTATIPAGQTTVMVPVTIKAESVVEGPETFQVVLGTVTTGSAAPARGTATGTIYNATQSTINVADASVDRSTANPAAAVHISLTNPSSRTVSVDVATADGSAQADIDYQALHSGTSVSFAPGETTKTVVVPIVDDGAAGPTKTFSVVLSGPTGGLPIGRGTGTVTITDSRLPRLSISSSSGYPGTAGTDIPFVVSLDTQVSNTVTVRYATADGTARAGADYDAASGTVTFRPGETSRTVSVHAGPSDGSGTTKTFAVGLSSPTNANLGGTATGTGSIVETATAPASEPALFVSDTSLVSGLTGATPAVFTVALSSAPSGPVTVDYATADGTATAAEHDYQPAAGTLTFQPGETTKTVSVAVAGSSVFEPAETFALALSNAHGASIAKASGLAAIVSAARPPVVAISRAVLTLTRHGLVGVVLRCPAAATGGCRGTLRLTARRRALGARPFALAAGRRETVHVRLSPADRALVARLTRLAVTATATTRDEAGAARTVTRRLTLRAASGVSSRR